MPPTSSQTGSQTVRKRQSYTAVACEKCQRRKIKCSGGHPCERCRNGNMTCTYPRMTRFRTGRRESTGSNQVNAVAPTDGATANPVHIQNTQLAPSGCRDSGQDHRPSSSSVPGSFDYYLRLAESRFAAKSPEKGAKPQTNRRLPTMVGSKQLRDIISCRKNSEPPGKVLGLFDMRAWTESLQLYDEEIGLQYPFLDVEELTQRIQKAKEGNGRDDQHVEDLACLVFCLVSYLVDPSAVNIASPLVQDIFSSAIARVHVSDGASIDDLGFLILSSMFFFLSDKEIQAWRSIGTVMRVLYEMRHHETEEQNVHSRLYWTAYTLDRRFSFGTGLPCAVPEIDRAHAQSPLPQDTSDLSSAYLRQMVAYSGIASEVCRTLLNQPSHLGPGSVSDDTMSHDTVRDFAYFRVNQWQSNIPKKLRFQGVGDKFDPAREKRGEYKLRLMLYLRANQMRTIILRKAATMSTISGPVGLDDASSTRTMFEVAQDTVRILVYLGRDTDIYQAQHRTFNHFLETALSSLLLVVCCTPSPAAPACLNDVIAAIDLIRDLSQQSQITNRLYKKLKVIQEAVDGLKPSGTEATSIDVPATLDMQATGNVSETQAQPEARSQSWPLSTEIESQGGGPVPITAMSHPGFGAYHQPGADEASINMATHTTIPHESSIPDHSASQLAMGGTPGEMYLLPDMDGSRFRELSDIFMDYDNFAF